MMNVGGACATRHCGCRVSTCGAVRSFDCTHQTVERTFGCKRWNHLNDVSVLERPARRRGAVAELLCLQRQTWSLPSQDNVFVWNASGRFVVEVFSFMTLTNFPVIISIRPPAKRSHTVCFPHVPKARGHRKPVLLRPKQNLPCA